MAAHATITSSAAFHGAISAFISHMPDDDDGEDVMDMLVSAGSASLGMLLASPATSFNDVALKLRALVEFYEGSAIEVTDVAVIMRDLEAMIGGAA